MKLQSVAIFLVSAMLTGCGSGLHPAGPVVLPDLTGNWQIQSKGAASAGPLLLGSLTEHDSQVSGVFRFVDLTPGSICGNSFQAINFSGAIDSNGRLNLKSDPFDTGSTIQAFLTVSPTPHYFNDGDIVISGPAAGGGCVYPGSPGVGVQFASVTATYSGSISLPGSLQTSGVGMAVLTLTQAAAPSADGQYAVTGNVSFTGNSCSASGMVSGTVSGATLSLASTPDGATGVSDMRISASPSPDGTQLLSTVFSFKSGACSAALASFSTYSGTLNKN